jgi:hypothetical protein
MREKRQSIGLHPDQYVPPPFSCVLKRGVFNNGGCLFHVGLLIFRTLARVSWTLSRDFVFHILLVFTHMVLAGIQCRRFTRFDVGTTQQATAGRSNVAKCWSAVSRLIVERKPFTFATK